MESFWGKLDLPWPLTLDFVCLLFYFQYRPVQTDAPATGAANIVNFSCLFERAEIQIPLNKYECPQRLGNLFRGSFSNHNTRNYLRRGINVTTNQRLSQHSRETVTRLLSAIHRRLLSLFFLRKGRRLYTGYLKSGVTPWDMPSLHLSLTNKPPIRVLFFGLPLRAIPNHKMCHNYVKKKDQMADRSLRRVCVSLIPVQWS